VTASGVPWPETIRFSDQRRAGHHCGGLPTHRALPVVATPHSDWGWSYIRIVPSAEPVVATRPLSRIGVDYARFVSADADTLNAWMHDDPIDGLADVVFWGRHESEIAAEFAATRTGTPGENHYGRLSLPGIRPGRRVDRAQEHRTEPNARRRFPPALTPLAGDGRCSRIGETRRPR
jgi:hypothetical protein